MQVLYVIIGAVVGLSVVTFTVCAACAIVVKVGAATFRLFGE